MNNNCGEKSKCCCGCKISFSLGLTSGLWVFILGLIGTYSEHGLRLIDSLSHFFPGFAPTIAGCFIGAVWAFVHVFIFFSVAGIIYRILMKCCSKCCQRKGESCSTTGEE